MNTDSRSAAHWFHLLCLCSGIEKSFLPKISVFIRGLTKLLRLSAPNYAEP
jgi:hypothetical protein